MRLSLAALLAFACLFVPVRGDAEADGSWPFGAAGRGPAARGRDLYNLGLLGAKARDADREPAPAPVSGRRSGATGSGAGADEGPTRLRIELLYPDGPAEKAGLQVGDRIVGVGRSVFKEGSLDTLAAALLKAEAGKGKLTLLVARSGSKKPQKIDVVIPVGGKPARKPYEGTGRTRLVDPALSWLAEHQAGSGGYTQTLSGINGAVVQTALAGLAWLAGGSDLKSGPYAENLRRAATFVAANAGQRMAMGSAAGQRGGKNWDQTNWGFAHAAIFLGELHARSPDPEVRAALITCGEALARCQEVSGGWAHGPGGPNALGYVELNIVSGLALGGLGLASQGGYELPRDVLVKAEAYLKASSAGDGGVGYSDQPGQKGQGNIGRTAAAWLGFRTLGLGRGGWGLKMKKWAGRNAGAVFGGHASLMQHILLGGVAAHALGGKARTAYWKSMLTSLVLARAPDGSFQPRPWHESLSMGSNSDVTFGQVWTTAAWAIVLACEPEKGVRPGLPYWMGLKRVGGLKRK